MCAHHTQPTNVQIIHSQGKNANKKQIRFGFVELKLAYC
jgi:hypothetical protein